MNPPWCSLMGQAFKQTRLRQFLRAPTGSDPSLINVATACPPRCRITRFCTDPSEASVHHWYVFHQSCPEPDDQTSTISPPAADECGAEIPNAAAFGWSYRRHFTCHGFPRSCRKRLG